MTRSKKIAHLTFNSLFPLLLGTALILVLQCSSVTAQNGPASAALAPGSPAGAYPLSGFDTINPYNGNLNFSLPLLQATGRGSASALVRLTIGQQWTVQSDYSAIDNHTWYYAEDRWWNDWFITDKGYSPGMLVGRYEGWLSQDCQLGGAVMTTFGSTLTRFTFTAPDGTEYELRDKNTKGAPANVGACNPGNGQPRGTEFITADGTSATFISDEAITDRIFWTGDQRLYPNGYLMTRDGTRYRIDFGHISWMRDRNGNKLSFTYDGDKILKITDSLNREINFQYDVQDVAPYGLCDKITYKGFGGADRAIRISYKYLDNNNNTLRSGYSIQTMRGLFPDVYYVGGASEQDATWQYKPKKVSAVWLPNESSYQMRYNSYGELARVELPTGGAIEYDWVNGITNVGSGWLPTIDYAYFSGYSIYRRVTERRVYANGSALESTMTFGMPEWISGRSGYVLESQKDGGGTLLSRTKHYYFGIIQANTYSTVLNNASGFYQPWKDGREYQTDNFDRDGTTLLRSNVITWAQTPPLWYNGTADYAPPNDPHITQVETILADTNQHSKQTFSYDQFNNLTDIYDYDYGNGAFGLFLRRTHTDYLTTNPSNNNLDYTGTNIHIRNLPSQQWISSDAAGNTKQSLTIYEYDKYTTDAPHAALLSRSDISGLCTTFNSTGQCANTDPTSYTTRGNVTSITRYTNAAAQTGAITVASQYDVAGNVVEIIDANNIASGQYYATTIDYTDNFGVPDDEARTNDGSTCTELTLQSQHSYAFAKSVTNPLGHTIYSQYSYYLGKEVNSEDANGVVSSSSFNDALDRPKQLVLAANIPALRHQKSIDYDDANLTMIVTSDLRSYGDKLLKDQAIYDGLGRTIETRAYENGTDYIATKTVPYILLQHPQLIISVQASQISNPYRPQQGEQPVWTTSFFDSLGRTTNVRTGDNAQVKTSYSGNQVTVTDQTGKQRRSLTDALGRLIREDEPDSNNSLGIVTSPALPTSYTYNVLGNLLVVTQGGQTRAFVYDSLSRLTSETKPESGTVSYGYDSNGNLLTKTDARGTSVNYAYDTLNRPTTRSYSGGTAVATPTVTYTYDATGVTNSKGRLTSVSNSVAAYNYTAYDALGRVTSSQQITDGLAYPAMSYSYGLAGNMTSQTYPTGRVVVNSFDNAGRLTAISGQKTGEAAKTYANSFGYTAHGAIERLRLGNGRWEHTNYDPKRLQPVEIGLGTSGLDSSLLKLQYDYGTTDNNGNVKRQIITVPTIGTNTGFTATQHYRYDQLNRLTGVQEVNGESSAWQSSSPLWQQIFSYDSFGNRAVDTNNTTSTLIGPNPTISTATNRITPRTGEYYEYDLAGNLRVGQSGDTFAYDGENKLVQYAGGATQIGGADYFYDGDGRRVKKVKPSETTIFVYNIDGQLVAEYTTSSPGSTGTSYLTTDTLGSPRIITKADGSVRARHDYLPFGEELYAGAGNRTENQAYDNPSAPVDQTKQKFTGKERDTETALDYFGARYYASTQGRFTSPDPLLSSGIPNNPQTWNRYAYVLNNPLKYIDPLGLFTWDDSAGGDKDENDITEKQHKRREAVRAALRKIEETRDKIGATKGKDSAEYKRLDAVRKAYGDENVNNHVLVGFEDKGGGGDTDVDITKDKDGKPFADVYIRFKDSYAEKGNAYKLADAAAHEGYHAYYGQEVAAGRMEWRSRYDREFGAFETSSIFQEANGKSVKYEGGFTVWNNSWGKLDSQKLTGERKKAIDNLLSKHPYYADARPPKN